MLAPHCLVAPLLHIQPVSKNIHSTSPIPNKIKQHKNIKAINTSASPSLLSLVSITIVCKHSQLKTGENVLPWNPKTSSCSHLNPKIKNLLSGAFTTESKGIDAPKPSSHFTVYNLLARPRFAIQSKEWIDHRITQWKEMRLLRSLASNMQLPSLRAFSEMEQLLLSVFWTIQ